MSEATATGPTVVVGAARGIGAEIARCLARDFPTEPLVLADRDADGLERLAAELHHHRGVTTRVVDLADGPSVAALVESTGPAQRVAIAAGIFAASPSLEVDRDDFSAVLEVNLIGVFDVARRYAAPMVERGSGSIVAVASVAARSPRFRQAVYSASKAGMRQALRVLGMEVASAGVRVNTVSPGPTDTPMLRELASDHASVEDLASGSPASLRQPIPIGHVGSPADVAAVVSFLLSDRARHVVLQDVVVDGGELLGC